MALPARLPSQQQKLVASFLKSVPTARIFNRRLLLTLPPASKRSYASSMSLLLTPLQKLRAKRSRVPPAPSAASRGACEMWWIATAGYMLPAAAGAIAIGPSPLVSASPSATGSAPTGAAKRKGNSSTL